MSKVEELLQEINDTLEDTANSLYPSRHRDFIGLDDVLEQLISAAREEGRAEGAEQERERIRKAADHYEAEDELPYAELVDGNYVGASCEIYVIPASVLAPAPKEEGKL